MTRIYSLLFSSCFLLVLIACTKPNKAVKHDEDEQEATDSLFLNPIHTSGPDPWVFQANGVYYLTFTTGANVTLHKSKIMSDLNNADSKVVWTPPSSGPNSKSIWAPEIHRIRDKWYIFYAADDGNNHNHRMYVLENDNADPMDGTWTDKGMLALPDGKWAIDGTIFEHNNQLYYLWSGWEGSTNVSQQIYICKMDDPLTPVGERILLTKPELSWETNGVSPTVTEGPQVLRHEDKIFIIYSAGGCWTDGYALGMLTTDREADLMSPDSWEKSQYPVFSQSPEGNAYGPGHNSFFQSIDGTEDWIIYHANPESGQGCGRYRPIIDANVFVDDDGTNYLYYSRACYKHPVESEIASWAKEKGWYEEIEESRIYGVELKPDFSGVVGEPVLLLRPPTSMEDQQAEWESRSVTSREINRRWTEGSFTFKRNGTYYIMYSANYYAGKNYAVGYATGTSPLGPFTKAANNPVLQKNTQSGGEVTGTGHNMVLFSPDSSQMYAVYHGRTRESGQDRVVFIDEMRIEADGKLIVDGPSTTEQRLPFSE